MRTYFVLLTAGLTLHASLLEAQVQSTWDAIQSHVLNGSCTDCHSAGTSFARQSGLVLTEGQAYGSLLDVLPQNNSARQDGLLRVSSAGKGPGLFQSYLWEKINAVEQEHFYQDHPNYGALMPLGKPVLTNGELELVKQWILAGAPETGVVADAGLLEDTSRHEPPDFVPLEPPENGIQFHLGPFDVWPSEKNDREFLYFEPYETNEDVYVNRYEISYRPGSHHFILYNYPSGERTPRAHRFRDIRDQNGQTNLFTALELGLLFPFSFFVGTQTPSTNYHFPPGVALRLPPGSGFDLNSHSVNRTDSVQVGEVYVNLHTVAAAEVEHVADYDNFGNFDIFLPPNEISTLSQTFRFDETRHIFQLWSHSHEHTLEFRIEGVGGEHDGELIYWTNDWEHPPLLELDPPLTFRKGDQIRLTTTYNNWTDEPITFGPLSSDEMQFMFYLYYTDTHLQAGDADRDLKFDQLDLVQVQIAGKYLTGQRATWGEGDWNGAPGGNIDRPPRGDRVFDQLDIVAALRAAVYLSGRYTALQSQDDSVPNDSGVSVGYDSRSGELWVESAAGHELTSINIDSAAGIFVGGPATNLGGSFDNDSNANIFKATFGGSFSSVSFGHVALPGLTKEFVLSDLSIMGSLDDGRGFESANIIFVPEPSARMLTLLAGALLIWTAVASRPGPLTALNR